MSFRPPQTLYAYAMAREGELQAVIETKRPALAKIEASKVLRDCTVAFQHAERAMRGGPAKAMICRGGGPLRLKT